MEASQTRRFQEKSKEKNRMKINLNDGESYDLCIAEGARQGIWLVGSNKAFSAEFLDSGFFDPSNADFTTDFYDAYLRSLVKALHDDEVSEEEPSGDKV